MQKELDYCMLVQEKTVQLSFFRTEKDLRDNSYLCFVFQMGKPRPREGNAAKL